MEEKVIIAKFGKTKVAQTEKQWRYNHGQKLKFEGVDLPANYEVHFSNSKTGTAKTMIGNADGVLIPQEYFVPGEMIYAWVYVEEDGVGVTRREVRIPIDQKARPTDQQPLPEEQTVIEQAIEALNDAVNEIPNEITTALAEAKASGTFDGTQIWWVFTQIGNGAPNHDGRILKRALNGKEGEAPLVGDFVYGPAIGSENRKITDLYVIEEITGIVVFLKHLDSIKGEDGFDPEIVVEEIPNGHRVTITSANGPKSFDVMNGTFEVTGPLSMENYRLTDLADGVDDTDAVNKAQVDRMIREGSGLFRGSFSTKASLNMAAWQSTDPTQPYYVDNNDYCVVLSDETQHYECWRYGYVAGSGWAAQYRINEAPMTAAQIAAINSGITADRLVGLEQFKNTAQPKLSGIEAGAQVNKIEAIRAVNPSTGQYEELPIANKTVDIPQRGRNVWYTDAVMVASLKVLTRDLQGPSTNPAVGDYVFGNSVSQGDIDSLFRIESVSVIFAELSLIASFGRSGGISPYTSNPAPLGTASPGSSDDYARGDHVHENNLFVCVYGTTTNSEINTALNAGKAVVVPHAGYIYYLSTIVSSTRHIFGAAGDGTTHCVVCDNGSWSVQVYTIPTGSDATPQALGTAAAGSSPDYSRADHVHAKPTYSKSDVGLGNVDNVQQYSSSNPPPYPVSSVNGQTGAVSLPIPSTASDVGAVAVAQGVAHAGEFVVVGSDGNVTTMTLATWQGGSF